MKQSHTAAEKPAHSNNFNLFVDSFDQDEIAIAHILLLLSKSRPKKSNHKVNNDNFSLIRDSKSFLPDWACKRKRSAANDAVTAPPPPPPPPPASDTKDLQPSPAAHPLLFSSSESDEKLNRKIRVLPNKKRQELETNVKGLVGYRESLREELEKKKAYHYNLQEINSALKTMKQDLSTTTTTHNLHRLDTSCSSSMNCSWQTQIQNFHQPYNIQMGMEMGMGSTLFFLSASPDLNAMHPTDLTRTFSELEKKAKCAAARKLRMAHIKMKKTRRLTSSSSSSSTANIKMQTPQFMSS